MTQLSLSYIKVKICHKTGTSQDILCVQLFIWEPHKINHKLVIFLKKSLQVFISGCCQLLSTFQWWWQFGIVVMCWFRSTKLLYARPGYYWNGWLVRGSTPGAQNLSQYTTSHPGQLSLAIPPYVSISQRVVMLCSWTIKAGMVLVWVALANAVVTCETKLFQPLLTSNSNKFISVQENLPEIISKLFHVCTAAPTCSLSLK